MKIPLNRAVAFAGPYISLLAGALAAWLVAKLNVLGLPGLGEHQHELATGLAAAGTWALATAVAHLGQMKWLKGVHVEMASEGAVAAAALAAPGEPVRLEPATLVTNIEPVVGATYMGSGEWLLPGTGEGVVGSELLVTDDVEFASPPPGSEAARPEAGRVPDPPTEYTAG